MQSESFDVNNNPAFVNGNRSNVSSPRKRSQVVIIGAGLAGLAAAQRLHEKGIRDVIILEAQDRIGGRVHTVDHSDYLLEMGAQWLHGADENPLYEWLMDKNMLEDFEDASLGLSGLFCSSKGGQLDEQLVQQVLDIVVGIKLQLFESKRVDLSGFRNAAEVFRHELELKLKLAANSQLLAKRELVLALFDWFLRYETIENCCDSMSEVSVSSYTAWTDWGDGNLINFKQGYRSLLAWFCDNFPSADWIHLNKQVLCIENLAQNGAGENPAERREISSSGSPGAPEKPILVRYRETRAETNGNCLLDDNDPANQATIECDHAIITVSLGFLKRHHQSLFKPSLPAHKRRLIDSIGFGTVNKIVLQFEAPFWDEQGIKLIWERAEQEQEEEPAGGRAHLASVPDWARDIIAFDGVRRQPNLLIGWIGGFGAKQMELESDEEVGRVCMLLLEKFLPKSLRAKLTPLINCICSRWHTNPFTCGSYSFQSMSSFELDVEHLHEPIYSGAQVRRSDIDKNESSREQMIPRLLFAGEATSGELYSTTHGAIISGWREADRLAQCHHLPDPKLNFDR